MFGWIFLTIQTHSIKDLDPPLVWESNTHPLHQFGKMIPLGIISHSVDATSKDEKLQLCHMKEEGENKVQRFTFCFFFFHLYGYIVCCLPSIFCFNKLKDTNPELGESWPHGSQRDGTSWISSEKATSTYNLVEQML